MWESLENTLRRTAAVWNKNLYIKILKLLDRKNKNVYILFTSVSWVHVFVFLSLKTEVPGSRNETTEMWDNCVHHTNCHYSQRMHNICCQNCHHHTARALEQMKYRGLSNWSQITLGKYFRELILCVLASFVWYYWISFCNTVDL